MTHNQARISVNQVAPEAYKAVLGLEQYIRGHVDATLLHLIKLRASMVNGCSFCVDMHSTEALKDGIDGRKLFALAAWREGPFFDARERAALALTDDVTHLGRDGVPDAVWDEAVAQFGEEGTGNILVAIATINVWNRLAITTRSQPPGV
ncbi:carboxymuconolactone decarboxylase family protein [Dactylosporangium sp. CS-047395]|uniref:carboxymuconolactone decarboxylase family protein n=1 Tax=Dactylosporangium sp. CS-047395 TaxID=3239936 RepID=UPI003D8B252E